MLTVLCRVGQCVGDILYQLVGSNAQFLLYDKHDDGKMQSIENKKKAT